MRTSLSLIATDVFAGAVGLVVWQWLHQPALALIAVVAGVGAGFAQRNLLPPRWLYLAGALIAAAAFVVGAAAGSQAGKRFSLLVFAFGAATAASAAICRAHHNPYPGVADGTVPRSGPPSGD